MTSHMLLSLALRSAAVGYVLLLIFLPLATLTQQSIASGWDRFIQDLSAPQAAAALWLVFKSRNKIVRVIAASALITAVVYLFTPLTAAGQEFQPLSLIHI